MTDRKTTNLPSASEKRGGYSGGQDASKVKPPPKTPSASAKPKQPQSTDGGTK